MRRHQNIKMAVKVGAVVLVLATAYLLKSHGKFKQLGEFWLFQIQQSSL